MGIEERLSAWRQYHDVSVDEVPLFVVPQPIDLCHSDDDAKKLLEQIKSVLRQSRRDLIRLLKQELGREPSTRESLAINNAAAIAVRSEMITAALRSGDHSDAGELVRLGNVLNRVLASLKIGQGRPPAASSLQEHLRQGGTTKTHSGNPRKESGVP